MELGKVCKYKVLRETNLGYVLEKDGDEYFLHHNECNSRVLRDGEIVSAFLYLDKKFRPALTLFKPIIKDGEVGFLKIVGVNNEFGVFCNIGISKDILLSKDDLPHEYRQWPQVDDELPCELKAKFNKLSVRIASKNQMIKLNTKEEKLKVEDVVEGIAYRISPEGINFVTNDYEIIFVFKNNYRKKYHLGEKEMIKIIDVHEDDYSGMINKNKELQIVDDLDIILNYLNKNNGVMMITDKSEPELINRLFGMSKKAFKNALGSLYKQGKIEILDDKIILNEI